MNRESALGAVLVVAIAVLMSVPGAGVAGVPAASAGSLRPASDHSAVPSGTSIGPESNSTPPPGIGEISVGADPDALALDPTTGILYVADDGSGGTGSGALSIVNTSTSSVLAPITGFADPEGIALDGRNGYLFVPEFTPCCPASVTVFDTRTDSIVTSVPIGTVNPGAAAFDSRNGYVYVSNIDGQTVSVLNGSNDLLVATVPVARGGNPGGLAFDAANGNIYVPNTGAGNISVINGTINRVVGSFALPGGNQPLAIAVDSQNGYLYVADRTGTGCYYCGGNVTVLNATTGSVAANIPIGADPVGLAVDNENGKVYVTGIVALAGGNGTTGFGNLTVIDGTTDRAVGTVPLLPYPSAIVFDPANGNLYVADGQANALLVVPADISTYPVTVTETGLPNGTAWFVQLSDGTYDSSTSSVTIYQPNGTYAILRAESDNERYLARPLGPVTVNGTGVSVNASFVLNPDLLTFHETGLPNGTYWVVGLAGAGGNSSRQFKNSSTSSIQFLEYNGTFSYEVISYGEQYAPHPRSGSVVMNGSPVTVLVSFVPRPSLTFTESGLPNGTFWSVELNESGPNATAEGSDTISLTFYEPNATYSFSVGTAAAYAATPRAGNVTVNGTSVEVFVVFTPAVTVLFVEFGLPNGTAWSVTLNGVVRESTNRSVEFVVAPGSYPYAIGPVHGYREWNVPYLGTLNLSASNSSPLYVFLFFESTISEVVFSEVGLPAGADWTVTFNGTPETVTNGTAIFTVPDGNYSYQIGNVVGYQQATLAPSGVIGANVSVLNEPQIEYTAITYVAHFSESGLPTGELFSVVLHGVDRNLTTDGGVDTLTFVSLANGTYSYTITDVSGWHQSTVAYSGHLTVAGGSAPTDGTGVGYAVDLGFTQVTYQIVYSEVGLPTGTSWGVTLGAELETETAEPYYNINLVSFEVPNGTYDWSIQNVPGWHQTTNSYHGAVRVNGFGSTALPLYFTQVVYPLSFTESGLPTGANWSVLVGSTLHYSTSETITFDVPNGTATYSVGAVNGYDCSRGSGSVGISGAGASVSVPFTNHAGPAVPAWVAPGAAGAAIGVVAAGLAIGALLRRPRKAAPAEGGSPSEPGPKQS